MTMDDDVVAVLAHQHRRLEAELRNLLDAADAGNAEAGALLRACAGDELAVHILATEQIVYPAVHAAGSGGAMPALQHHGSLKRLLSDLLRVDLGDASYRAKCQVLDEQLRRHRKDEEERLYPAVRRLLDAPSRRAMGAAVKAHEQALHASGAPRERMLAQAPATEPVP